MGILLDEYGTGLTQTTPQPAESPQFVAAPPIVYSENRSSGIQYDTEQEISDDEKQELALAESWMVDDRKQSNALTSQQFQSLSTPGAESRGMTTTYTPPTIVDSTLAVKLADTYGGKPSDYQGKTSTSLADKIGSTPTQAAAMIESKTINQDLAPSKARNIWESVTPWKEDKGQTFGNIVEDTFRETVSLGKIQTNLYNKEEIASDYSKLQTQQDMEWFLIQTKGREDYLKDATNEYNKAAAGALAGGYMLTQTRDQYLKQVEKDYDEWVAANKPKSGTLSVLDDKGKPATFNSQAEYAAWLRKQQPSTGSLAKEFGIGLIPIVGTARNWDNMGNVGRGASVLGDLLFIVPVIGWVGGAAVKTGATAARTASISGRIGNIATSSARLTVDVARTGGAALKGLVTTPINLIRSPIATTKSVTSSLKVFGSNYVSSFKAGLKPSNIKSFGETLIGTRVYTPKIGGALVGGESIKQIKQIEGTRPMTQGDVTATAKAEISDVTSKTAIPRSETFSVASRGNAPQGQNIGLTYIERPKNLIIENPNYLDSTVSPVMATQTRKLTEQELLGGLDIVEPGTAGGGRIGVMTPVQPSTSSGIAVAPQMARVTTGVNLIPAIAVNPIMPNQPMPSPFIQPVTTPQPYAPMTAPSVYPNPTPTPVVSPSVNPTPIVSPSVNPIPDIMPSPIINPPATLPKSLPVDIATTVSPYVSDTGVSVTPIPIAPIANSSRPKATPPALLPIMPFSLRGGGGGSGDSGKPSLNSLVGQWETKGLFVGITDPKTGKVIVGGIKGRRKFKYGNIPSTLKSRVAGGGNVASAGGRLIKRVNVV